MFDIYRNHLRQCREYEAGFKRKHGNLPFETLLDGIESRMTIQRSGSLNLCELAGLKAEISEMRAELREAA